jgi:putative DNA primase/helicase
VSPGEQYLIQRGISLDTAARYGVELDNRVSSKMANERLGRGWPRGEVNEVLWFPVYDPNANIVSWIARPLPNNSLLPRFVCQKGSGGPPLIFKEVWAARKTTDKDIIITEGAPKGLVLCQAGALPIALNGVWMAVSKNSNGKFSLREELLQFQWLGRRVDLCFDADQSINEDVLWAVIRTAFAFNAAGAQVFQLTTWQADGSKTKGIDDYLAYTAGTDPSRQKECIEALKKSAQPFFATLRPFMLPLVEKELEAVAMSPAQRSQLCKQLADPLKVRAGALEEGNFSVSEKSKPFLSFAANYQPWPDPVAADELFGEVMARIGKEVTIEPHQLWVCGLWVMFTWVHPQMDFSPSLYVTGPTMECGKTTLLNAIAKMVRRPAKTANVSAAAIYRLSELFHPSLLMDEAQDQLTDRDFWLVIKSGHTPGECAIRCNPNTSEVEAFDVFCPKLLAGIGRAGAQIMSRSIIIEMERKDGERDRSVKESDPIFTQIHRKLARWANDAGDLRRFKLPKNSPSKLRNRDNWEALYRVACGVNQAVAEKLVSFIPSFIDEEQDYSTYLLDSLRKLYSEYDQLTKDGFMGSDAIVDALNQDREGPWYAKNDKGLTREALASRLRRYKVKPDKVWQEDMKKEVRGYHYIDSRLGHKDLKRSFEQYLKPKTEAGHPTPPLNLSTRRQSPAKWLPDSISEQHMLDGNPSINSLFSTG